jgi:hypothetical protein
MAKVRWFPLSILLLLVASFVGTPRQSLARPSLSDAGQPIGIPFVIMDGPDKELEPALVTNPQRGEYLVVWYNDLSGNDDIHAARLSRNGQLLKHTCVACGPDAERHFPDVAYNSTRNEYLVVWLEESLGMIYVRAQRLGAEGQLVGGLLTIVGGPVGLLACANPTVAYASTPDRYLVVWEHEVVLPPPTPGSSDIMGQMVSGAGALEGAAITISHDPGGQPRQKPDVAYNRHANGHLVVWQQWDPGASRWSIYGRLLNGDGGTPFGPIWISDYIVTCSSPGVAAIPTSPSEHKFLVVWEIGPLGTRDIYGRMVTEAGVPSNRYVHFQQHDGIDQSSPAIAGDERSQRYMVVWRHPLGTVDVPIHGRSVSSEGLLLEGEAEFPGPATNHPAVTSGFLVAWEDKAPWATNQGIYGQFWGNRLYLPLTLRRF